MKIRALNFFCIYGYNCRSYFIGVYRQQQREEYLSGYGGADLRSGNGGCYNYSEHYRKRRGRNGSLGE